MENDADVLIYGVTSAFGGTSENNKICYAA
jgi:hypothetical protein